MDPVWVITWIYQDNSGYAVVAVRKEEEQARKLLLLLSQDTSKKFELWCVDTEPT